MTDQDEEFSSQLIQEEEDFFFDDDSDQEEPDLEESSTSESGTNEDTDESFRRLLAGPSGNKVLFTLLKDPHVLMVFVGWFGWH